MKIKPIGTAQFLGAQRDRFRSGELADQWAELYPEIFDSDDLRLAKSQPSYHFLEWLGAVVLYSTTGYLSLIEKYEFGNHSRKVALFRSMLPPDVLHLVTSRSVQCPDLFVYSPDHKDWFFCEIKGQTDRLGVEQEKFFEQLGLACGRPVALLRFEEMSV